MVKIAKSNEQFKQGDVTDEQFKHIAESNGQMVQTVS